MKSSGTFLKFLRPFDVTDYQGQKGLSSSDRVVATPTESIVNTRPNVQIIIDCPKITLLSNH